MIDEREIIRLVEADQAERGLNDSEYAEFLGIDKSYYSLLRSGKRKLTIGVLGKIHYRLPDLWPKIEAHIRAHILGIDQKDDANQSEIALRGARKAIDKGGMVHND